MKPREFISAAVAWLLLAPCRGPCDDARDRSNRGKLPTY